MPDNSLIIALLQGHKTTAEIAAAAGITRREAANKLRALASRGIVRQWHTDPTGERRYGCVCWKLIVNDNT